MMGVHEFMFGDVEKVVFDRAEDAWEWAKHGSEETARLLYEHDREDSPSASPSDYRAVFTGDGYTVMDYDENICGRYEVRDE